MNAGSNHPGCPAPNSQTHRVVIVGGGFGGLTAAHHLRRSPVEVTLVDRRNFHLFQPLLYQVATGALSPANIAAPLRSILERQKNCTVLLGEVVGFDVANRRVRLVDGELLYDTLIVAAGAWHSYFAHPEWEQLAPGLKTIEDATEIRGRVLAAFEEAERTSAPERQREFLTFVIVGGGPTGVELAGALAEVARHGMTHEFRHIRPADAQVLLIEAGDRVLAAYPQELSEKARKSLERLGVVVRTSTLVSKVSSNFVELKSNGVIENLPTHTVLWAAGVQASPLAKALAEATGALLDRAGRITIAADLSLPGHPEILVLGDMALSIQPDGKPLPGIAPVAIQQGKFVARLITAKLKGQPLPTFQYHDMGNLATIGRWAAVADFGRLRFSGAIAWLLWLFIHLMNLVSFRNRMLVFMQWGWNYLTYDRSARLITGKSAEEVCKAPDC
jgi:NADH:ubiquinone reductase (H+-translocating)